MDKNMRKRNELLAQTVIKGLKSRNMSGYYAADKEEAVKLAMELIPEGSSIAMGGCMSAQEIGLIQVLEDGNYNYIDRAKLAPREGLLAAYDADSFLFLMFLSMDMSSFVHIFYQKSGRKTMLLLLFFFSVNIPPGSL